MDPERKIYTKKGDRGETSLLGGTRVKKNHLRVEAYGTLDELNSFLGVVRSSCVSDHIRESVLRIQEKIFIAESWIAADPDLPVPSLPVFGEEEIIFLEKEIDSMNEVLPELGHFIIPGGNTASSWCHVSRTICRRAERTVLGISSSGERNMDEIIIRYLNRLSDYLFVLARKTAQDAGAQETLWLPEKQ